MRAKRKQGLYARKIRARGRHARRQKPEADAQRLRAATAEQEGQFQLVLEKIPHGVGVFDAERRLVVSNTLYATLYGLRKEAIRPGMALHEIVDLRFAAGSAPILPDDKFRAWRAGSEVAKGPLDALVELRNGRVIRIHHQPLADGSWVTTHEDVTERIRSETELRRRNLQFDAAISNMSQGLCMFNANEEVIVCNLNYCAMFRLSPDFVKPGVTLYEVLQHSVDIAVAADSVDELYRIRREIIAARRPATYCETLADGRIIDIWHRPMADGGWVSTYEDITERRRAEQRVAYMATHDPLTDLPNRAALGERLRASLADAARDMGPPCPAALLLIDLDRFKEINDTLGHAAGDRLLCAVAARLRDLVEGEALIARLGGDEFAILHPIGCADEAARLSQRIIRALAAPFDLEGHQAHVGASVGIALAPQDGREPEALLKCADLALYRAKAQGRGDFAFFKFEMTSAAQHRRAVELELREALRQGQFEVFYQPQISLKERRISGAEALIRWRHPTRGLVGPGDFIAIAEEVGLIAPIGEWIMRQACRDASRWPAHLRVAVNMSAVQFRNERIAEMVVSALAAAGLPPTRLELEITETVLLEDTSTTLAALHQLRALGVRVSLDDFGTGYSSLSYLRSFPFDKIKIDRSFVREIADGGQGAAIIRAIASLGTSFGMDVTAEGVETDAELEGVLREGCTEAQGYLFSAPLPAREMAELFGAPFALSGRLAKPKRRSA